MQIHTPLALAALTILVTSCATPNPPQAFHNTDRNTVVIDSLDDRTGQMLEPAVSDRGQNDVILAKAMSLSQRQTVVVILENYSEPKIGWEYRDRGTPWFVGLRGLGYQHIVFLRGTGVTDPERLPTVSEYF